MRSSLLSSAIAFAVAFAVSLGAQSVSKAGVGGSRGGAKTETYIVVKITDEKIEYKAITKTSLKDETKRLKDDYDERYKSWKDEVKSDPKAPRPKKPLIKPMPNATFETQKGAQDYAEKLNKEEDEKEGKKPDDPANPAGPPRRIGR